MSDCSCEACRGACWERPGWFALDEAEKAAALLGVPFDVFFRTRLAVDYWEHDSRAPFTYVLAPVIEGCAPGEEYPEDPHGRCTFLTADERCEIHEAKPAECRDAMPCVIDDARREEQTQRRFAIVRAWGTRQGEIRRLLSAGAG